MLSLEGGPTETVPRAWAAVLAGGEGLRLRPLIREIFGDERPKQFAPLVGAESLLRQTLNRTARLISRDRTAVVSCHHQADWVARDLGPEPGLKILLQPENRDTAAGVLLPAYWAVGPLRPRGAAVDGAPGRPGDRAGPRVRLEKPGGRGAPHDVRGPAAPQLLGGDPASRPAVPGRVDAAPAHLVKPRLFRLFRTMRLAPPWMRGHARIATGSAGKTG